LDAGALAPAPAPAPAPVLASAPAPAPAPTRRLTRRLACGRFANVQPHSGAQANQAVMFALAAPGDTVLGMSLAAGGHLTHGAAPNQSGKWFRAVQYGVDRATGLIDYAEVERLALEARPRVIIAGGSAYSRVIDFAAFREVLAAPPQLLNPKPSTTQPHHQHSVPPRSTFSQNRESALFGGVAEV